MRHAAPQLLPATLAHNRRRDLAGRRLPAGVAWRGVSWLTYVAWACARELASVDETLGGSTSPACVAARDAAYHKLVEHHAAAPDEIARALGIADHRAYAERDRAGGGSS